MDREIEVWVEEDGRIVFIHDDEVAALFADADDVVTRRASDVEPTGKGWTADMARVAGPVLTDADGAPFPTRRAALDAEVAWLQARMDAGPITPEER